MVANHAEAAVDAPPTRATARTAAPKPAVARAVADNAGYLVEPTPGWVVPAREGATARVEPAPFHYRVVDEQIRVEPKGVSHYHRVVRAVNDAAGLASAAQIEVEFDPSYQTLALHQLRIVRDGKPIDKLDRGRIRLLQREAQLERQLLDGRTTLSVVIDDVRPGDQIDYAYSIRGANPVFEGKLVETVWTVSPYAPTALYQVRLLAPADRQIRQRAGSPDIRVTSTTVGGLRETLFRREGVPQFRVEPDAPASVLTPQLVQMSEFADWAEVASWGQSLFGGNAPGPLVAQKAAEIRAAESEPAGRLLAALDFVQREVRYFGNEAGIGSHRPASPEQVIAQRFGDCKDKVGLLVALLRRLDIEAVPVLVSPRLHGHVDELLPGPAAFEHVIARVDLGGAVYFLDATRNAQHGTAAQRQSTGFGKGLRLAPGTTDLAPLPPPFDVDRMAVADTIRVARFADAPTLESKITYRGEMAEALRDLVAQRGAKEVGVELARAYLKIYPRIETVGELGVENGAADDGITFVQRFTIPGFWRFPDQRALQADIAQWGLLQTLAVPRSESRQAPLAVPLPGRYRHSITLEYPEDIVAQGVSQHADDGDSRIALSFGVEASPRRVVYSAELRFLVDEVAPADWTAFNATLGKLAPRLGGVITVAALSPAAAESTTRELKELEARIRRGREKVTTPVQAQALLRSALLTAQIDAGRLEPALAAQALAARGIQYDHLGRYDDAKEDFTASLALSPDAVETQNAAATNALALREFGRAVRLSDTVLQRQPRDSGALNNRALARYFQRDLAGARTDLEALLQDRSAVRRGYPIVWLSMAMRQSGDTLATLRDRFPADQLPIDWPRPLVDMATGTASADAAVAAAKAAKDPVGPLCEAYFYVGEKYFSEGDLPHAKEYWQKAADMRVTEFVEYGAAKLRLAGIGVR